MIETPSPILDETTYCEVHPDRETGLRCNKCGRLMCTDCAVHTPVGYRCRECMRAQEKKFFTATTTDIAITFAVCAILTGIIAVIVGSLRLPLLFAIILGLPVGGAIAEAALRITQRRRGRNSAYIGAAGAVIGGLAGAFVRSYLILIQAYNAVNAGRGGDLEPLPLTLVLSNAFGTSLLITIALVAVAIYGRYKLRS